MEQILIGLNWSLQRSTGWARERNEEAIRTWAPRGETPALGKTLSAVAGITFLSFYFRLYAGPVKAPHLIDFPASAPAFDSTTVNRGLGRTAGTPQPSGSRLSPNLERADSHRIPAKRRARVEKGTPNANLFTKNVPYDIATDGPAVQLDQSRGELARHFFAQCIACGDKLRLIAARRARKWRYD